MSTADDHRQRRAALAPAKRALLEERLKGGSLRHPSNGSPATPVGPAPLSSAQRRFWLLHQLAPESPVYNIPAAMRIVGPLSVEMFAQALQAVIARHDALRARVVVRNGHPVFEPSEVPEGVLDVHETPAGSVESRDALIGSIAGHEARRPFDLSEDLPLRAALYRLAPDEHLFTLTVHHIAADGWSMAILFDELGQAYNALCKAEPLAWPQLPMSYRDYALSENRELESASAAKTLDYWRSTLEGAPPLLDLACDKPRPATQSYQGNCHVFTVPDEVVQKLEALGRSENATPFVAFSSVLKMLLARYTAQHDIVIGTPVAGRHRAEYQELVGCFVNTIPLRTDLSGNPSFMEVLRREKKVVLDALEHQSCPFERMLEALQPHRARHHAPIFQVMLAMQNAPAPTLALQGLTVIPIHVSQGVAKLDLTFSLAPGNTGYNGWLEYNTDIFVEETAARMARHFVHLLEQVTREPSRPMDAFALMPPEECRAILDWGVSPKKPSNSSCFHHVVEAWAETTPDAPALVSEDETWTYRRLNAQANRLARRLTSLGVGPESIVAVVMPRSPDAIVAILAVLKAGGAYAPIDPNYPRERVAFMLQDCGAVIVLTHSEVKSLVSASPAPCLVVDEGMGSSPGECEGNLGEIACPNNLAYVIYTSGSTGWPKGTLLEHAGIMNMWHFQRDYLDVTSRDHVLQFASLSFDGAVWEIVMALGNGATLHLASQTHLATPQGIDAIFRTRQITIATLPPALLQLMQECSYPALRVLLAAGESCPPDVASRWASGRRFFNAYGPTEVTVGATIFECRPDEDYSPGVPIGRAMRNKELYVVDAHLRLVPPGVPGELLVGGVGLARGYLHRPELSAERFITMRFDGHQPVRVYRTGDLVKWRHDGQLVHLGRLDDQVKIRGFRVELGEIETMLNRQPEIRQAAVLPYTNGLGDSRLAAYLVPANGQAPFGQEFKRRLAAALPDFMLPAEFHVVEALPMTPTGKVDRRALRAHAGSLLPSAEASVQPRDTTELELHRLWQILFPEQRLGVKDDFFMLGGHSLLAVHLAAQIRESFGIAFPVSGIFENPTIERLAAAVKRDASPAPRCLVPIQPKGTKRPFFCVHSAPGSVFCYVELARHLGVDQPFYGLQAAKIEDAGAPVSSISDMAARYLDEVRTVQPHGPYRVGGHSLGGVISFEMARRLQEAGESVSVLAILDCAPPPCGHRSADVYNAVIEATPDSLWLAGFAKLIEQFFGRRLEVSVKQLACLSHDQQVELILTHLKEVEFLPPDAKRDVVEAMVSVCKAGFRAAYDYVPGPFHGRITFFKSESDFLALPKGAAVPIMNALWHVARQNPIRFTRAIPQLLRDAWTTSRTLRASRTRPRLGWEPFSEVPLQCHVVSGNHVSMLTEPHVRDVAKKLSRLLDSDGS